MRDCTRRKNYNFANSLRLEKRDGRRVVFDVDKIDKALQGGWQGYGCDTPGWKTFHNDLTANYFTDS